MEKRVVPRWGYTKKAWKQKNLFVYQTGFPKYPSSKLDFESKYMKNVM